MNPSAIPGNYSFTPYGQGVASTIAAGSNALNGQSGDGGRAQADPSNGNAQKGNWFTHLLPTIGSIAAPVVGAALAPETGGLSLLAALALAGGGSAAGKAAEDVAQGQSINPTQLAESAAEGAGGQFLGAGAGSVVGGIAGKATDALGNAVEGRAAQTAADAATQDASTEAARIGNEFGAIKPGQAQVGPALDKVRSLGIEQPTAKDLVNAGNIYTGSNPETGTGVLNFYKQQALDQAGGNVNLDNTMSNLHTTLATPENQAALGSEEPVTSGRGLPQAPNNTATKIVQQVRNMLPSGSIDKEGQITEALSPQDGFSLLKNVGNQISQTTPKPNSLGVLNPSDVAENNVWKSVYNTIKSSLYNRPEVDAAVSGLQVNPEVSGVIDDAIKSNGITDPAVAANIKADLSNTLNNSSTAQDLLDAERPMVNVSRTGNIAQNDITNNPQLPRNVRGAKAEVQAQNPGLMPTGGEAALDTAAIAGAPFTHGASLVGALPTAIKAAKSPAAQDMAYKLANAGVTKKVASAIPAVLTGASQFITHAPDSTSNPVNLNLGNDNMQPQQSQDPNSINSLLLKLAIAESANPSTSSAGAGIINQVLPQMQNSAVAQNSLTGAENAFQQAGGGQGGLLGNLSKILGGITGNPASQYEQQRSQLINQLTPLGIPTSAVPDITGNNQSAGNQFQTLQQMINARLNGGNVSAIPAQ